MSGGIAHPRESEAAEVASAWLDLTEAGKDEESFTQLAAPFRANLTPERWRSTNEQSRRELGRLRTRTLRRVVVYENQANSPLPGTYAAVEYDSVYDNASKHFQYVMLHSEKDGPFRVMRREAKVLMVAPK
jgi:hypothetical protein